MKFKKQNKTTYLDCKNKFLFGGHPMTTNNTWKIKFFK